MMLEHLKSSELKLIVYILLHSFQGALSGLSDFILLFYATPLTTQIQTSPYTQYGVQGM